METKRCDAGPAGYHCALCQRIKDAVAELGIKVGDRIGVLREMPKYRTVVETGTFEGIGYPIYPEGQIKPMPAFECREPSLVLGLQTTYEDFRKLQRWPSARMDAVLPLRPIEVLAIFPLRGMVVFPEHGYTKRKYWDLLGKGENT